jgi:hypothetical protein
VARVQTIPGRFLANANLASAGVPTDGLWLWFLADTEVTVDANNLVSFWGDQSGRSADAEQSVSGLRPIKIASYKNGLPVIRFGGAQFVAEQTGSTFTLNGKTGASWFFVGDAGSGNSVDGAIIGTDDVGGRGESLILNVLTPGIIVPVNSSTVARRNAGSAWTADTFTMLTAIYDGSGTPSLNIYKNGTLDNGSLSGTIPASIGNAGVSGKIGEAGFLSDFFVGNIGEILVYSRAVTSEEQTNIQSYLNTRWAIF